jgi:Zn-dependent protease
MGRYRSTFDNPINWSFKAGRLFGIDIRVHLVFILSAIVLLSLETHDAKAQHVPFLEALTYALGTYGLLFLVVLLHEFGHCFGARYVDGEADEILIWPLGGLAMVSTPHHPRAHMITTLAGPMVNVVICAIISAVLIAKTGRLGAVPWNPLHPTTPVEWFSRSTLDIWLMRLYGVSYVLLLFNMMPVFPFDGGRVLQAWLWPRKGYTRSMEIATSVGMGGAIAIGLFALFTEQGILLLGIAAFGYLNCWQMRRMLRETGGVGTSETGEFGYDFSRGYASLDGQFRDERRRPGFFERRRLRRATRRAERERQRRADLEAEVERILSKVSNEGLRSLTPKERRTLETETQRKRLSR